jgi:hypothetical protein
VIDGFSEYCNGIPEEGFNTEAGTISLAARPPAFKTTINF